MPDEKPGQSVEQKPPEQGVAVPLPENHPISPNAAEVREEQDENRITNLEGRMGRSEKIMAWLTGAIAFFALVSIFVGLLQWNAMSGQLREMGESTVISRESLVSVQRAFIFLAPIDGIAFRNTTTKKIESISFIFHWENSGVTPTKEMTSHFSWQAEINSLPEDFQFPDLWDVGQPHVNGKNAIGPKGVANYTVGPISASIIEALQDKQGHIKGHLYFWGWARYHDIFPNTPEHITEFCAELTSIRVVTGGNGSSLLPGFQSCPKHNCYDEQCKEQPPNPN